MLASFPGLPCFLFFGLCHTDADPLMNDLRQAQPTLADKIVYRASGVLLAVECLSLGDCMMNGTRTNYGPRPLASTYT